jgi:hypothetical protein
MGTTTELLAIVSGCVVNMSLNDSSTLDHLKEQDQDLYHAARRVYWTAFVLDRFHASSRSKDAVIPLRSGSLSRDDHLALGDVGYYLACMFVRSLPECFLLIVFRCCPDCGPSSLRNSSRQ